jgi:molybdopterin-binding protein
MTSFLQEMKGTELPLSLLKRRPMMNLSARNILRGRVKQVTHAAVNAEVTIELPGGTKRVSIITKSSAERLHLAQGSEVCVVIKAHDVMVATD